MREWFILFLFLSLQLSGYNPLSGGHLYSPGEKLSVSANKILTVPIGGSGTGEETGDGTETGTGTGTESGTGTETGED
jgi:hypothetical protein